MLTIAEEIKLITEKIKKIELACNECSHFDYDYLPLPGGNGSSDVMASLCTWSDRSKWRVVDGKHQACGYFTPIRTLYCVTLKQLGYSKKYPRHKKCHSCRFCYGIKRDENIVVGHCLLTDCKEVHAISGGCKYYKRVFKKKKG